MPTPLSSEAQKNNKIASGQSELYREKKINCLNLKQQSRKSLITLQMDGRTNKVNYRVASVLNRFTVRNREMQSHTNLEMCMHFRKRNNVI